MPRNHRASRPLRYTLARLRWGLRHLLCFATCTLWSVVAVILSLLIFTIGATISVSCASAFMLFLVDRL